MELLRKTQNESNDPRQDNADKKVLFGEGRRPQAAAEIRAEWSFIEDEQLLENISYQVQYLQFQINLYNEYQMYLTLESLHLKNIMGTIGGIVEAALYGVVKQASDKAGYTFDERRKFLDLIYDAYDMQLLTIDLRDDCHTLRKDRNLVHFRSLEYREYNSSSVDEVNDHLEALADFISSQTAG